MRYPVEGAESVPGSGTGVYLYLLENYLVPARSCHDIWYSGQEKKLKDKHDPFKGFFPVGQTLKLSYGGGPMGNHKFTGEEKNPVFVKDLHAETILKLGIPNDPEKQDEKVFNPNFLKYDDTPDDAKVSNEATTMSLAKSISAYLCGEKGLLYSEIDVVNMLTVAIKNANSAEMRHILHGNHIAWCSIRFMVTGVMEADIKKQFYGQNTRDFYMKDLGTIMPSMLYTLAILGVDPVEAATWLDYDLYEINVIANDMQQYMKKQQEGEQVA